MTSLSMCVLECVCSLRRLQTGHGLPVIHCAHRMTMEILRNDAAVRKQKPLPWGVMVFNHALSCCYWNMANPALVFVWLWYCACFSGINIWLFCLSQSIVIYIQEYDHFQSLKERVNTTWQMTLHLFYAFVPSNCFHIFQMQHCFGGFKLNQVSSYHRMTCTGMGVGGYVVTAGDQRPVKRVMRQR